MINITNNLNEMFEFANVDNNDLDGGEDLEDGEIFDDEAEPEEKSEPEIAKNNAKAAVEIQKSSPASNSVAPVAKTVLKNDTHNVSDKVEKKNDRFSAQPRWTEENNYGKKEEVKKNREQFDNEKRFKERKLKRKKTKDEDSENDGPGKFKGKKRKTSFERELEKLEDSDYIDEDDEEMLNIRGASPSRWLDMFSDEEEDSYDGSEGGRGGRENMRGAGRGGRRGGRGFRGGRIDRNARRERIERLSSRGKRRGKGIGMRGGKKMGEDKDICIYHMQGKCHKGDDCPFSHDALPPRKMELCKFYLMDCCAKKDKCLYMHSEFPCKYFHTGLKCFAGKNCKFSHAKLTDDLRAILNKTYGLTCMSELTNNQQDLTGRPNHRQHLETAPKEILGDFPRHVREATRPMKKNKKIPSLFDVRISPPRDMQSDSDGNHTPMPSPTHQPNNKDFFRDSMEREHTPPPINDRPPRRGGSEHQPHHHHHHHHKNAASATESSSSHRSGSSRRPSGGSGAERRERRDRKAAGGRREDEVGRRLSPGEHQQHHHRHHHQHEGGRRQQSYSPPPARHQYEERDERPEEQQDEEEEEEERVNERLKAPEPDQSSNDILSHLPKKQRELFLRIQQQQRQAENSQESNPEDDDQDNDYNKQEENWYSSEDEESTPLTTILKTINIQKTTAMAASGASMSPNQRHHHHHHHQNNHHDRQTSDDRQLHESSSALPVAIPDINFGDVSALLSKVKQHFQTTADRSTKVRDPRLRPDSEPSEKQPHQQHSTGGNDSHARLHAPAQLSPSISAILNSAAGRAQHHQSSFSSPPSSHHHSSFGARSSPPSHHHSSASFGGRSSPPSHHHSSFGGRLSPPSHHHSSSSFGGPPSHHHSSSSSFPSRSSPPSSSYSRSAFPPATPMLNDDDDGDDDDNGISSPPPSSDDVNSISGLPFKPVPVHSAATEIDASINSHPPIVYRLVACYVSKPDYGAITTMPAGGALDPRWRKSARFNSGSGDETSRRDPRHRLADLPADPRHRTPNDASAHADPRHRTPNDATAHADPRHRLMPANQSHSMMAPPTPRYDDDPSHMGVRSGLMVGGGGTTPLPQMDVYCPPTPRLDADDTPPTPHVRPTDPRQRHMSQQNQGMTSLYDQLRMQQQQQFMPSQQSMMFDPSRPSMYGSDMPTNRQAQYNNYK